MKKLKRYQYERYAILCQLAYPDADEQYQKILDPFYERQLVDKYGRMSVRILWVENKKEVIIVFRGSLEVRDWLANLFFIPNKLNQLNRKFWVHWGFARLLAQPMYSSTKTSNEALPLRELLVKVLEPLRQQGKRFTFIGHSSGGAVAVLMADYFERLYAKSVKRRTVDAPMDGKIAAAPSVPSNHVVRKKHKNIASIPPIVATTFSDTTTLF